ncbi:MAG: hypothetical protein IPG75_22705 [Gemmatimonadetes bacterium]|nr:hypothetical protein [Gemmatimonadota bacterium]
MIVAVVLVLLVMLVIKIGKVLLFAAVFGGMAAGVRWAMAAPRHRGHSRGHRLRRGGGDDIPRADGERVPCMAADHRAGRRGPAALRRGRLGR